MIPAGEPCDVASVADHGAGDDGADAEDLGEGGPGSPGPPRPASSWSGAAGHRGCAGHRGTGGEVTAGLGDGAGRGDRIEEAGSLACGDFLGEAARHEFAQHCVEPAGDLVAGPGQIPVPLGPHLQYRGIVLGHHLAPGLGAQRGDRDGQGIVGIVLAGVPGLEQPDPGGQLWRDIQHPLPGRDQLLGQQMPQPAGALHRPGPLRPVRCPRHQLLRLGRGRADPQPAQRLFACANRHRGMRAFVRVHPDHHAIISTLQDPHQGKGTAAGMPNSGSASARASFEPRHGKTRQAGTSI